MLHLIKSQIQGIPCFIDVTKYDRQKPNPRADNPDDYRGYTDIEYAIFDRASKPAPWLQRIATKEDHVQILDDIEREYDAPKEYDGD